MKLGQLLLKEPLKEACQRKQWWGRKKEEWTLTRNPATLFFVVSASSRSVNYRDTAQHSLPRASPPKPQSLLLALSEKTLSLQNFQPLFTLSLFSTLFHSNPRGTESFLYSYQESYKKGNMCWMRARMSALLWHAFFRVVVCVVLTGQLLIFYPYSF